MNIYTGAASGTDNYQFYHHIEKYYAIDTQPVVIKTDIIKTESPVTEELHKVVGGEVIATKTFSCDLCIYKTLKKQDFTKHISTVHKKQKTPCPECGKHLVNVAEHIKLVHRKEKRFHCAECEYKCCFSSDLQKHIDSVHRRLKHSCPECRKEIVNVAEHIRLVHKRETQFKCHQCNYTAYKKQDLKKHLTSVHKTTCTVNNFSRIASISKRVKVPKKRLCQYCHKEIVNVAEHIKLVHIGVKNYKCDKCDYKACKRLDVVKHSSTVHKQFT
jgi:KRAB domain-containing zinc finger protein